MTGIVDGLSNFISFLFKWGKKFDIHRHAFDIYCLFITYIFLSLNAFLIIGTFLESKLLLIGVKKKNLLTI